MNNNNNIDIMNSTITQSSHIPYTLLLVIPGRQVYFKTKEEQVVK